MTNFDKDKFLASNNVYMYNPVAREDDKVIYLTFDVEWIHPDNVNIILDVIKEKNVSAAFFLIGYGIKKHADIVRRIVSEGHITLNHTMNHVWLTKCTKDTIQRELEQCNQQFYEVCGKEMPKAVRPPYGAINFLTAAMLNSLGYKSILWSMHFIDYDMKNPATWETITNCVDTSIKNGVIILQHAFSPQTTHFLGDYIDYCRDKGYRFGSLDEFLDLH